ncbi:ion transporter [Dichotomicrobium thermohalophilum]|uniref:Voltage-gated sodium channel n=1 Tax=Dichotomicrobium thermohalophilum TaxID=933063 RepID=A0A397Q2G4_9HYPH|nr:ion transporter [Dichotomicrobium thermohalophilum]RIA55248.1 voltage-gated sodium channel [Dichotomicrobium thermohalophilum]
MSETSAKPAWKRDASEWRARVRTLVDHPAWERTILTIIILNAVTLGLETSDSVMGQVGPLLLALDAIFLTIFVVEIAARLIAHGARFWRDPWSVFDFSVVAVALIPATESLSGLRALRILRALRLISAVPSMRRVVTGLFAAVPGMTTVVMLLALIFYVFSVMATMLYGDTFPQYFGTIGRSAYSLFQIMTLESWSESIVRPVLDVHPMAWLFFIPFILVTSFAVLNLFIGIIVDSMQEQARERLEALQEQGIVDVESQRQAAEEEHDWQAQEFRKLMEELKSVRAEVASLRAQLDGERRGGSTES